MDVLEGALADVVEAGLIAMQEGELVAGLAGGEKAVADGVEGRSLFSGGSNGAARAGSVGAGRKDAFLRRHSILYSHCSLGVPGKKPERAWNERQERMCIRFGINEMRIFGGC